MKHTKSILGDIAFLETNANKPDSLKKIPEGWKAIPTLDYLKLRMEDNESLKDIPRGEYLWTKEWACRLLSFGRVSNFNADDRWVVSQSDALRGVVIIRRKK